MPDLGHEPTFGVFLPNPVSQTATVIRLAHLAEQHGLDLLGVQDHPYNPDLLETWTLLSHLAGSTGSIRLFPDVACVPLRPPAMLARAAASLDLLSGGRVELGVGAGAFVDPIASMGGPALTAGQAVDALEEAIGIIRRLWTSDDDVSFDGRFHRVIDLPPGPRPAHDIGIWVGGHRPRMLRLVARLADGWVPSQAYVPRHRVVELAAQLDDLAIDAGRSPADIVRVYNVNGRFGDERRGFLNGPPTVWAEQLTDLVLASGFSTFVLSTSGDITSAIGRFADEVAPDVRERVAAHRRSGTAVLDRPAAPSETIGVAAAPGPRPLERDGRWGSAGGLRATERPRAPVLATADVDPDDAGGENHRNLVAIHDHLRSELVQIRDAVSRVATGEIDPANARSVISRMTVRQNHWTLGSFCASYCRLVTIHHTVEDAHTFPALAEAVAGLDPVLKRLQGEHEVIAAVLERFDRALVDLVREEQGAPVPGQSGPAEIARLADELSDILLSHLAYEEDELADALTLLPVGV